ncbi:MAG: DUF2344 domain-containing protein [Firmicutes bacterium]|nr:DUF2344 domain-containing protein [Bacillota bacterium]
MRIWIEFALKEPLRFLSHLDLLRTWQRAVRRAAMPLVYSQGFNPHPKMAFAAPLPVGATSLGEYVDIQFATEITDEKIAALQAVLPAGLEILQWRVVPQRAPALMSLVKAAEWSVKIPNAQGLPERVQKILQATSLPIVRRTKKKVSTIDLRPYLYRLEMTPSGRLEMLLAMGNSGGTKPREVLELLQIPAAEAQLLRRKILLAAGPYLQSPMAVLLKEKEVFFNAEADYYQL